MARATTSDELDLLAGDVYQVLTRIKVEDADGLMRDYRSQAGANWQLGFETDQDVDQPVATAKAKLWRQIGSVSLSPLRTDSTLNRDGLGAFAPAIDAGRRMTLESACVVPGVSPTTDDWKPMHDGVVDKVDCSESVMVLSSRDNGGALVDATFTGQEVLDYTANPTDIEDVIQEILNVRLPLEVRPVVNVPVSPSYLITKFGHDIESGMDALQRLVQVIGWDLRYRFDDTSGLFLLTLLDPQRAKTTPDITFSASQIIKISDLSIDRTNVRNVVTVLWGGDAIPRQNSASDEASIRRFGRRVLTMREGSDSPIDTDVEAQAMAQFGVADLKDPKAAHTVDMFYTWPVEISDLVGFAANNQQYDTDQTFAVVGIKHAIYDKARTTLTTRGAPVGAYRGWLARAKLGTPVNDATRLNIARVTPAGDSPDGLTRSLRVLCGSSVDQAHIHYRTALVNAPGDPLDFSDSPDFTDVTAGDPHTVVKAPDSNHQLTFDVPLPSRDYRLSIRIVPYAGMVEGDSWVKQYDFVEPVQSSIIAGPTSANNGQTATIFTTFNTNTAIGAACARYSLDNGGSWTDLTVSSLLLANFDVTRILSVKQRVIVQGKNATDGNWGDQGTCDIDAYLADGPSLSAVYVASSPTAGNVVWSCPVGTVSVEIDGGLPTTPSASPIAITLDTNTHSYLFKATNAGQLTAVNVPIPALPPTPTDAGGLFDDTAIVEVDNGHIRDEWTYFGDPATKFEVWISYDAGGFALFETTAPGATNSSAYPTAPDVLLPTGGSAFLVKSYLVPKLVDGATTYTGAPSAVFGSSFFR